jgi:hypothetical protein
MGLKYFNKAEYPSINEALSAIRKELLSLCPTDTDDVRWSRALDGAKAYVKKSNGAGGDSGSAPSDDAVPEASYNGYFTIKLRTLEDGTQKIVVCDGTTYNAEKGTSKESKARVNNVEFLIPYYETDVTSGYIVLQCTPAVFDEDGVETTVESIEIKIVQDTQNEKFIYEIGECTISDNTVKIIQRHGTTPSLYFSNGIAYIEYFIEC